MVQADSQIEKKKKIEIERNFFIVIINIENID